MSIARAKHSTTVRTPSHVQRMLALSVGAVDAVLPAVAARWAETLFFTPPPPKLTTQAETFLASGTRGTVRWGGLALATWTWTPPPCAEADRGETVVLYHGWGGRASQMSAFVRPLLDAGFRVVALDAPGHGASQGKQSSIPVFAAALTALVAEIGPVHAVVAHSMGGTATALALRRGLPAGRVAFIGSPANPLRFVHAFGRFLGLAPTTVSRMLSNFERRVAMRSDDLVVSGYAPHLRVPLLVVHDADDEEVPVTEGEAIARAWPGAGMLVTSGLGHRRILRDPDVVARVVGFVSQ